MDSTPQKDASFQKEMRALIAKYKIQQHASWFARDKTVIHSAQCDPRLMSHVYFEALGYMLEAKRDNDKPL